jgi:transcriptional regulator with XRE-family HTH domain
MGDAGTAARGEVTLKLLRQRMKKSAERVARETGVSYGAVVAWEKGAIPSLENAIALSKTLDVSLKELCAALGFSVDGIPDDQEGP